MENKDNEPGTEGHQHRKPQLPSNKQNWENKDLPSLVFPSILLVLWFRFLTPNLPFLEITSRPPLCFIFRSRDAEKLNM